MRPAPHPPNLTVKGWRFELDTQRIRRSDTWALAAPEVRPWLLMLWMVAWEQSPCGSLPKEDELIAAQLGMPMKSFTRHKAVLMRGWWEADDGRLYHNVVVERVQGMLAGRESERIRQRNHRNGSQGVTRDNGVTDRDSQPVKREYATSTGTGTGTGSESKHVPGKETVSTTTLSRGVQ